MNSLGIVISTCQHYFDHHVPNLINSLELTKFPKSKLLIVSGQENSTTRSKVRGVDVVRVPYSALHLTGLAYLSNSLDRYPLVERWLALPDTVLVGPDFCTKLAGLVSQLTNLPDFISVIKPSPPEVRTMDMGIISNKGIAAMKDYLSKATLSDPSALSVVELKKKLICNEDAILGIPPEENAMTSGSIIKHERTGERLCNDWLVEGKNLRTQVGKVNGSDKLVRIVIIPDLDMVKLQRNFRGPHAPMIMSF